MYIYIYIHRIYNMWIHSYALSILTKRFLWYMVCQVDMNFFLKFGSDPHPRFNIKLPFLLICPFMLNICCHTYVYIYIYIYIYVWYSHRYKSIHSLSYHQLSIAFRSPMAITWAEPITLAGPMAWAMGMGHQSAIVMKHMDIYIYIIYRTISR